MRCRSTAAARCTRRSTPPATTCCATTRPPTCPGWWPTPRARRALVILHGRFGEDGTIQGLLDLLGMPYQGSGVLGSARSMNKVCSKALYRQAGLPIAGYVVLPARRAGRPRRRRGASWGCPSWSSRPREGSSVGLTIVRSRAELAAALEAAFAHDPLLLLEAYLTGREITGRCHRQRRRSRPCRSSRSSPARARLLQLRGQVHGPAAPARSARRASTPRRPRGPSGCPGRPPGPALPGLQPHRHDAARPRDLHPGDQHHPRHDAHEPPAAGGPHGRHGVRSRCSTG